MNSLSTSQSWPILTGFLIFNTETQLTNLVTQTEKRCTQTNANNQKKKKKKKKTEKHINPLAWLPCYDGIFDIRR